MEFVMAYYPFKAVTGSGVDPRFGADAEITMWDHVFYGEADRDTESRDQFVAHMRRYQEHGCKGPILVFTLDEYRKERLMRWSEFLQPPAGYDPIVFFTTIHQVATRPFGEIWTGLDGHQYGVIQAGESDETDDA